MQQSGIIKRKNPKGKKAIIAFKFVILKTAVIFFFYVPQGGLLWVIQQSSLMIRAQQLTKQALQAVQYDF